jgi:hypothetical protein
MVFIISHPSGPGFEDDQIKITALCVDGNSQALNISRIPGSLVEF